MGKHEKLLAKLKKRPKDFTFQELSTLLAGFDYDSEKDAYKITGWERYGAALLKTQRHEVKESAAAQGFNQTDVGSGILAVE